MFFIIERGEIFCPDCFTFVHETARLVQHPDPGHETTCKCKW